MQYAAAALALDDTLGTDEVPFEPPEGTERFPPPKGLVNVEHEQILANVRHNMRRALPQFGGGAQVNDHIAIVGGGWSLNDTFDELRDLYFDGTKIVALNGAGRWLMERNIRPSIQVVLDARDHEGNKAFLQEPIPHCRYMLATQCAPSLFDMCEGRDVMMFHAVGDDSEDVRAALNQHFNKKWNVVPSAGTVGIVAICLMKLAGYRFQHLFGIDSCYRDKEHHAYPQALNDNEPLGHFWCAGREFYCSGWQSKQAYTFQDLIKNQGHHLCLQIHGDGLLAHMLKTGADLQERRPGPHVDKDRADEN